MSEGQSQYVKALEKIREAAEKLNLPIQVYGPELHMTVLSKLPLTNWRGGANEPSKISDF